ncbi:MAG: hypothetical protein VW405_04770, partial [Rhodospirillaceae bacterium]
MALDTSGLEPVAQSPGLQADDDFENQRPTGRLVAASRQETAARPAPRAPGDPDTALEAFGQNVLEVGKGVPGGAVKMGGTALKGAAGVRAGNARLALDALDKIDRGDGYDGAALVQTPYYGDVDTYRRYPQFREEIRKRLQGAAGPVTKSDLYHAGEAVEKFGGKILPAAKGYEQSTGRQLGEGLGTTAAGVAISLLTRGPAASAVVFAAAGAGEAVDRAVKAGATEEQIIESARQGIIPGLTDSIPVETLLGRIPIPGIGRIQIPANMIGTAIKYAGRIGWQALIEGIQEGGQEFLQNLIARDVHSPKQELTQNVLPSAGIGAGVGAISETFKLAIENYAGRRGRARPTGEREAAAQQPVTITPDDEASPLPTDLIAQGRAIQQDAAASTRANQILARAGLPPIGTRVTIERGGQTQRGTVEDAFTQDVDEIGLSDDGVRIRLDGGGTFEEFATTLRQSGVRIAPEVGDRAEPAPADTSPSASPQQASPQAESTVPGATAIPAAPVRVEPDAAILP